MEQVKLTESGPHLKASCPECERYITFVRKSEPTENEVIPFGKYAGKTALEISVLDPSYAEWGKDLDGRYGDAFRSII